MFTGIIEAAGTVSGISKEGSGVRLRIASSISHELKIDQSLSHDGVCLTVINIDQDFHEVIAVEETLKRSNMSSYQKGTRVNLERSMLNNGRFDGHIVQGHVDQVAVVSGIADRKGSWLFTFSFDPLTDHTLVEKGSVAVNGISLTCFDITPQSFSVAVIPYTYTHTNLGHIKVGDLVNLEFDIIGKYVRRIMNR